jgi:hypothetical protein
MPTAIFTSIFQQMLETEVDLSTSDTKQPRFHRVGRERRIPFDFGIALAQDDPRSAWQIQTLALLVLSLITVDRRIWSRRRISELNVNQTQAS